MVEPRYDDLLDLAQLAAETAARLLVEGLQRTRSLVQTKTSSTDVVTEMDHAAERLIVDTIRRARPDDAVIGEEGTDQAGTTGVVWVIDPIDGTTNYLYGHAGFAVSVAAGIGDRIVAGVVADPLHDEVFTATAGGGATRNGEPIHCSDEQRLSHALVATGFAYDPDRRGRQADVLTHLLPRVRDLRRMGAASVDLCSVACGRIDAYYERGLQPWDYAAGALIAAEAGARVGDLDGGPPSPELVVAAPPALFDALGAVLIDAGAPGA